MTGKQACAWCNETQSCRDISLASGVCKLISACPFLNETQPYVPPNSTLNEKPNVTYAIVGGVAGAVILGGALAGGVLTAQRRRNKDVFDPVVWAQSAQTNPLYIDRTLKYENPLYEVVKADDTE